jgi:hypothetical protein
MNEKKHVFIVLDVLQIRRSRLESIKLYTKDLALLSKKIILSGFLYIKLLILLSY